MGGHDRQERGHPQPAAAYRVPLCVLLHAVQAALGVQRASGVTVVWSVAWRDSSFTPQSRGACRLRRLSRNEPLGGSGCSESERSTHWHLLVNLEAVSPEPHRVGFVTLAAPFLRAGSAGPLGRNQPGLDPVCGRGCQSGTCWTPLPDSAHRLSNLRFLFLCRPGVSSTVGASLQSSSGRRKVFWIDSGCMVPALPRGSSPFYRPLVTSSGCRDGVNSRACLALVP